jgi:hypothetical protein
MISPALRTAAVTLIAACTSNVGFDVDSWAVESDVSYYEQYFANRPNLRQSVLANLGFAPHTTEYKAFMAHFPRSEMFESALIYYEISVDVGQHFFYWSGLRDGKCIAYYTASSVDYQPLNDCEFPGVPPAAPDVDEDRIVSDGVFVGLVISGNGANVIRRYALNPNVELGFPRSGRVAGKIESLLWR